ncbi:MAG: hypothetical protein PW734_01085 [Verrucomicrobium sp.]|nr:hypothetical protein [Verrucomicrobium sp.]
MQEPVRINARNNFEDGYAEPYLPQPATRIPQPELRVTPQTNGWAALAAREAAGAYEFSRVPAVTDKPRPQEGREAGS